jgi:CBS domain-containing protein
MPGSAASRQVLEQLLGGQRFQHLATGEDSKAAAAAAAAAAGMPYNVAVAAAQLLGSKGNAREAAAAAAAAVAVNEQQQLQVEHEAGSSAGSPLRLSLDPAELMSPTATPRLPPLTPATPVHPAVAAAAAAAIAAAAEAAEEGAEATAAAQADNTAVAQSPIAALLPRLPSFQLMRQASRVYTVPEEGEDCSSAWDSSFAPNANGAGDSSPHSVDSHVSASSSSSSFEEWGFRSLTGVVVGQLMTSPVYHVHQDREVSVALQLMTQRNLPGLLVDTGPDSLPGFLTHRDFFKASMRRRSFKKRQLPAIRVKDIMSHPVVAVDIDMGIEACAEVRHWHQSLDAVRQDSRAVSGWVLGQVLAGL